MREQRFGKVKSARALKAPARCESKKQEEKGRGFWRGAILLQITVGLRGGGGEEEGESEEGEAAEDGNPLPLVLLLPL